MAASEELIVGEFQRTLDERFRLSIPVEFVTTLVGSGSDCILAKERPGCLSLWNAKTCQAKLDDGIDLVRRKITSGRLEGRAAEVQQFGRLLSSRHQRVQLAGKGRLLIPEGFREFLRAEPGGAVVVVGAAICVEIWHPAQWLEYLDARMPRFGRMFDRLSS